MSTFKFPLVEAEKFYKIHRHTKYRVGFLRLPEYVRLTKDGQKPVFKLIKDDAIELHLSDPDWIPKPEWAFPADDHEIDTLGSIEERLQQVKPAVDAIMLDLLQHNKR